MGQSEFKHINYYLLEYWCGGGGGDNKNGDGKLCCKPLLSCISAHCSVIIWVQLTCGDRIEPKQRSKKKKQRQEKKTSCGFLRKKKINWSFVYEWMNEWKMIRLDEILRSIAVFLFFFSFIVFSRK